MLFDGRDGLFHLIDYNDNQLGRAIVFYSGNSRMFPVQSRLCRNRTMKMGKPIMQINQDRMVQTFLELVSIDSPSKQERLMADRLTQALRDIGLTVSEDDAGSKIGGNCGNLFATWKTSDDLPPLLFCAHMDTVQPAKGKRAELDPDGTIRSAGDTVLGADDLSAVTAILEALRTIKESGRPHRSLELLFSVSEETYCVGAAAFDFSKITAKEAYVLDYEGAQGQAAIAAPSILHFQAEIFGKASHAGFAPEQGVNAVSAAASAVSRIQTGRIADGLTLNIGKINGGLLTNIVPEYCVVEGEIRGIDHQAALAQAKLVQNAFQAASDEFHATLSFSCECLVQAYSVSESTPVVQRYFDVCRKRGYRTECVQTLGGSDNNILAAHGISGIVAASAMHACHSCSEYTTIKELSQLTEIVMDLMLDSKASYYGIR
jgi:tripeptide aminopeptidase